MTDHAELERAIEAAWEARDTITPAHRRRGARRDRDDARGARQGRAARRRAPRRRRLARQPVGEEGGAARLPAAGHGAADRRAAGRRLVGQGRLEVQGLDRPRLARRRLPRRADRGGAPLGLHRPGRDPDAELRQPRRLRRRGHDGRHLGDGRLLRPDREERPPVGRRRHRRRARADAGRPDDHRGRLLHRRPLRGGRGLHRPRGLGARHGGLPRPVDEDRRPRDRRGLLRRGAALLGRRRRLAARQAAARTAPPARASTAPSSSSASTRGPARRPRSTSCCATDRPERGKIEPLARPPRPRGDRTTGRPRWSACSACSSSCPASPSPRPGGSTRRRPSSSTCRGRARPSPCTSRPRPAASTSTPRTRTRRAPPSPSRRGARPPGSPIVDALVRSPDYLGTDAWPELTFRLDRLTPTSKATAEVAGRITMRGVTRPIAFDARVIRFGPAADDPDRFEAGFDLDRQPSTAPPSARPAACRRSPPCCRSTSAC